MLEAYNGGVLFGNSLGATVRKIALLVLNTEIIDDVEKAQILLRGKYLATVFLLRSESCRYGELILSLKK